VLGAEGVPEREVVVVVEADRPLDRPAAPETRVRAVRVAEEPRLEEGVVEGGVEGLLLVARAAAHPDPPEGVFPGRLGPGADLVEPGAPDLRVEVPRGGLGRREGRAGADDDLLPGPHAEARVRSEHVPLARLLRRSRAHSRRAPRPHRVERGLGPDDDVAREPGRPTAPRVDPLHGVRDRDRAAGGVHARDAPGNRPLRLAVGVHEQGGFAPAPEGEAQDPGARRARHLDAHAVVGEGDRVAGRGHHLVRPREGGRPLLRPRPQRPRRDGDRDAAVVVRARAPPPVRGADALDPLVLRVEGRDALVLARLRLGRPVRHAEGDADRRERLAAVHGADPLVLAGGAHDGPDEVLEALGAGGGGERQRGGRQVGEHGSF